MDDVTVSLSRYTDMLRRVGELAQRKNVAVEVLDVLRRSGYALPLLAIAVAADRALQLLITGGAHGDEPAGVAAALSIAQRLADDDCAAGAYVLPCLNPTGFIAGTRRNDIGYDLNRTYGQDPAPWETTLVRRALAGKRFQHTLDLHEDEDADGFYVWEHYLSAHDASGPAMVRAVRAAGFPIQGGDSVEGYTMKDGCVIPKDEHTSELVGYLSVYLFDFHTHDSITTESPARLPQPARVAMHLAAFESLLEGLKRSQADA